MKVNKVFWGNISQLRGHVCFILILRGRRADFKARAILVLKLRITSLLWRATLNVFGRDTQKFPFGSSGY